MRGFASAAPRLPLLAVSITLFPRFRGRLDTSICALVVRGKPPGAGRWSLPGGSVNFGEALAAAAAREALEELGLRVHPLAVGGAGAPPAFACTDALHLPAHHYAIAHVLAAADCGEAGGCAVLPALRAGDDARAAAWVRDERAAPPSAAALALPLLGGMDTIGPLAGVLAQARALLEASQGRAVEIY
jgi:ADP-ribose pyrophosphatase YjhB (NUDIX family)